MKEILTNEEIDTLLDLFRSEGPPIDVGPGADLPISQRIDDDAPLVSPIDLLKPNRMTREQIRSFERIFEGVAKLLSGTIAEKLRTDVQCDCVAVEQIRFQGWLNLIGGPIAIYQLAMPPLAGPVLFTATTSLLYGAVDRILGGSGKVQRIPKDFSSAEYTVADAFVGPCLDRVVGKLDELAPIKWHIERRFCNPSMAQVLPQQDVMLAVHFQISGDSLLGDLRLAFPYAALEPFLDNLETGPGSSPARPGGAMREQIERSVQAVPVEMSVMLGETTLSLRNLMSLRAGDVIPLATRVGQPLVAPVQGRPKFTGLIGTVGHRLAFQVGSVLE